MTFTDAELTPLVSNVDGLTLDARTGVNRPALVKPHQT